MNDFFNTLGIEATKEEFNKILSWIEELNEVNTDNIEPLISVNDSTLRLREDEITDGNYQKACRTRTMCNRWKMCGLYLEG